MVCQSRDRASGVDGVLELLPAFEGWGLAGGNADRLARPGVPALPGRSLGDAERPEAHQRKFLAPGQGRRDGGEDGVNRRAGNVLGQVGQVGDMGDEVGAVHGGARRGGDG